MAKDQYKGILNTLIKQAAQEPKGNHLRRLTVMASMIYGVIRSESGTLSKIGNFFQGDECDIESSTKKIQRFIDNKWVDWEVYYAPYIKILLQRLALSGELVFAMDGSVIGRNNVTLVMSVVWGKRAIPIAWLSRTGPKGHFPESMHVELVNKMLCVVPAGCRTVLLGDGEFDGSKLREVCKANGWEFVLRTSLDRKVSDGAGGTMEARHIGKWEGADYGISELEESGEMVVYWHSEEYESPIVLLTNMDLAEMACEYYRKRFSIETMFKSFKSGGFNIDRSRVENPERIDRLLIVIAMAYMHVTYVGEEARDAPDAKRYYRKDRDASISAFCIGLKFIKYHEARDSENVSIFSKPFNLFMLNSA
jgi:hypothetical protein